MAGLSKRTASNPSSNQGSVEKRKSKLRRQQPHRRQLFNAFVLGAGSVGGIGLAMPARAAAALSENWESVATGGTLYPSSTPASGTPYTIITSGASGLGTWTAITSDPTNAYYAVSPTGFGAGGNGNSVGEGGANHDGSGGSMLLQSPAFTLSDAASGGGISMNYIGGAYGNDVPSNISGLGTAAGNAGFGFMGVALVDPSGNIVASSSALTTAGSGSGYNYTLTYSGLSPTTAYTLDLIDDGTRGSNWGWNGIDNISIPSGALAVSAVNVFNWVGTTGPFNTGSNWDQGNPPSDPNLDHGIISNGGTATIGSSDSISVGYIYVGSNTSTGVGSVTQTGGTVTLSHDLIVGNLGGTGTYNLSGGTITTGNLVVGNGTAPGVGTFIQTGGSVTVASDFEIGQAGGMGIYNLSGGSLNYTNPSLNWDIRGNGTTPSVLNISGSSTLTSTGNLSIGEAPTTGAGTGITNVSGTPSINISGAGQLFVGDGGVSATGILNLSGGTLSVGSWISIGRLGATGVVNLSGSGALIKTSNGSGDVSFGGGTTGVGTLNQSGGSFTDLTSQEQIAENTGSVGYWNISGGVAATQFILVGYAGTGYVTLTGTAHITTNQLIDSFFTGSFGNVNLSGGMLTCNLLQQDSGTATLILNGTVIQAGTDSAMLLSNFAPGSVNVLAGGAIFDTNGHPASITSPMSSPAGVIGGLTKLGAGVLTVSSTNSYTGTTDISAGTLVSGVSGAIPAGTPVIVGRGATFVADSQITVSAVSSLNLNGVLIAHNGSVSAISTAVAAGYNNGAWNGSAPGAITSSAAAVDSMHLTAVGVIQNSVNGNPVYGSFAGQTGLTTTDVLAMYTYFGDANLDGKVDGSDYSLIDAGYASRQSGFSGTVLSGWYNGDFNYDGVIDGSDYSLIDNAFNNQSASLASSALVATANAQVAPAAVPEPACLAIVAAAFPAFLRRRRH